MNIKRGLLKALRWLSSAEINAASRFTKWKKTASYRRIGFISGACSLSFAILTFLLFQIPPIQQELGTRCLLNDNVYCVRTKIDNQSAIYEQGLVYEKNGRYRDAAKKFDVLSTDFEHPLASARLALYYKIGAGVQQNDKTSQMYFLRAERQHFFDYSKLEPEKTYFDTAGLVRFSYVGTDPDEAQHLYQLAADSGDLRAYIVLAQRLQGKENLQKRKELLLVAAGQGFAVAKYMLAAEQMDSGSLDDVAKYETLALLLEASESGYGEAQRLLAYSFEKGVLSSDDLALSLFWYTRAADQGNSEALFKLGSFYHYGYSVKVDVEKARKFYVQSAALGNSNGMVGIADLYNSEVFGAADYVAARKYYSDAAKLGHVGAKRMLGRYLWDGLGGVEDRVLALKQFEDASALGDRESTSWVGFAHEEGVGEAPNLPAAIEKYTESADRGDLWAQKRLGWLYYGSDKIPQNIILARKYFEMGVAANDTGSKTSLGKLLRNNPTNENDGNRAVKLLKEASQAMDGYADFLLSESYFYSNYEDIFGFDIQESSHYARLGYSRNDPCAAFVLTSIYLSRSPDEHDITAIEALAALEFSASKNNTCALNTLGNLYEIGLLVPIDKIKALAFYKKAFEAGSENGGLNRYRLAKELGEVTVGSFPEYEAALAKMAASGSKIAACLLVSDLLSGNYTEEIARGINSLYVYRETIGLTVDESNQIVKSLQFDTDGIQGVNGVQMDVNMDAVEQ